MLVEVVDLRLPDGGLDRDRGHRVRAVLVHLAGERARVHVEDLREPPDELVAALLGHVPDPQLDRGAGDVRDDRAAVPVEDRAARRLHPDEAELVVLRGVQVLVSRQHLQRPEAEEEQAEGDEGDRAEDADAQRQGRGEAVRLANSRVGREEALGGRAPLAGTRRQTTTSTSRVGAMLSRSCTVARTSA